MRCIETNHIHLQKYYLFPINYNMRCIETWLERQERQADLDKLQHEMYWNFTKYNPSSPTALINYNMRCIETSSNFSGCCFLYSDKLQHEMYWNGAAPIGAALSDADKLQHEMYWNTDPKLHPVQPGAINYNMRCIETK